MFPLKRGFVYLLFAAFVLVLFYNLQSSHLPSRPVNPPSERPHQSTILRPSEEDRTFDWAYREIHNPVKSQAQLPPPASTALPRVQHDFGKESVEAGNKRRERRSAVRDALHRCWNAYRTHAWMSDELTPISAQGQNTFGGWAATLVDTLDTLWIMGLKTEFREAVDAALDIDFSTTDSHEINVFETTIRYLGGFLAAYELSGDERLLQKTIELAEMLYAAFDTPNRLPLTRWDFHQAVHGEPQTASSSVLLAEMGSLTMEFTRLAQITYNSKWYDAVARITDIFDQQQNQTNLPGMWPLVVNAFDADFVTGTLFTLGAMSDSMYEYLPKMYALLGGNDQYARMYNGAMAAAIEHTIYHPMLPDEADVLMTGPVTATHGSEPRVGPEGQHLVCFAGGMLALGGRLFQNETHVEIGRKLTDGCIWTYRHSELGIMPETFGTVACGGAAGLTGCKWDEGVWRSAVQTRHPNDDATDLDSLISSKRLQQGLAAVPDARYLLRPEAIESVFILYRITGDEKLLDSAWEMFEAIMKYTSTDLANSAIIDVLDPEAPKADSMESFWTAETLKYFYLIFSEPGTISLDEWVFNTEAHPFKRVHSRP